MMRPSNVSLDEVRAVWETNVFGVLAVHQAMLPLLRESSDARIVNVSSRVGSLSENSNPDIPYHKVFGPVYSASKAALNAMTLAIMVELESTGIKVNLVSPAPPRRTSMAMLERNRSRMVLARWCALRCLARMARQAPSRNGKTSMSHGDH